MDRRSHIGPKLKALSSAINQEVNRNTAALDLTGSQAFFLGYLIRNQARPLYPKDLEQEFEFSHPTVSGILRRMEAKGFVTFRPSRKDKRCKQILVTDKALESHRAILGHLHETEDKITKGMTDEEVAELHRLLGIAMENMGVSLCCRPPAEQEDTI